MQIYFGIVENRSDPLELGRCQVRVVGLHTHDKNLLPTSDLPWCAIMQPTISAAMNGIGYSVVGPVEGTSVVVTYLDDSMQQGLILGSVGGIATEPVPIDYDDSGPILSTDKKSETVSLRTVPGPTNGIKLKFYDANANRTDLTSVLEANMRVSGYGITDGTTIVSIDSGTEITISNPVRDFGENILEFNAPLANAKQIVESKTNITAAVVSTQAESVANTPTNNQIPTLPPLPEFKQTQIKASEGIKALIAACDKVGLTTKEQKCALLGVVGGECGWIPKDENHNYTSKARLQQLFSFLTDDEAERLYNAKKKGISPEEFFSVIYGPTKRGKNFLGNKTDADGGKYFGRGFIGFTGRENYQKAANDLKKYGINIDLVESPELLDTDINVSALAAAAYVKRLVPSKINPNAHPGYFEAVKKAVGICVPDIAARKKKYYEHFYGISADGGYSKDAAPVIPIPVEDGARPGATDQNQPGPSDESIKTGSFGIGFRDPNNKYPLKGYIGESDINRLARGVIDGTVVTDKDAKRVTGIPKAFQGTWDQPLPPYAAKYPYNKVYETESGHVQEFDDTPGYERLNTYHRSGTFTEIDVNGTQVNYIVGDNFILMENNGCIHVAGECNITVDGNLNVLARSDANVQVAGNATVEVGNNLDVGVANDVTMRVGGDYEVQAGGQFRVTAAGGMELVTDGSIAVQSAQATSIKAESIYHEADTEFDAKAGSTMKHSAGTVNIKGDGAVNVDYGTYNLGAGAAQAAGSVDAVEPLSYTAPSIGDPLYKSLEYLIPPERQFEANSPIETPDDWDTPEGRAALTERSKAEGSDSPGAVEIGEIAGSMTGGKSTITEVDTSLIMTTKDFTNDYRLSKNFSLGMLIDGGVGGKHKLQAQMLSYKGSAERLFTVQEIVANMAATCQNVLEPMLEVLPGGLSGYNRLWKINSGYRLKGVVKHESPTSDHCKGHCIDLGIIHPDKYNKSYEFIKTIEPLISYDQLILEYASPDSVWIHIGFRGKNNRKQAFTMVNHVSYPGPGAKGFVLINSIPAMAK
jgi:predicted chitinase